MNDTALDKKQGDQVQFSSKKTLEIENEFDIASFHDSVSQFNDCAN